MAQIRESDESDKPIYERRFVSERIGFEIVSVGTEKKWRGKRCSRVKFAWSHRCKEHIVILDDGSEWVQEDHGWIHGGFAAKRQNVESAARRYMEQIKKFRSQEQAENYEVCIIEIGGEAIE